MDVDSKHEELDRAPQYVTLNSKPPIDKKMPKKKTRPKFQSLYDVLPHIKGAHEIDIPESIKTKFNLN